MGSIATGFVIAAAIIVPWVVVLIMVARSKGGFGPYVRYFRRKLGRN